MLHMQEYAYSQKYMGVEVSLSLVTETENQAIEIMEKTYATIKSYEERFSRFLPDSELSQLNKTKDKVVSEEFFIVLQQCKVLYEHTAGAFNPLLQIARFGYDRDLKEMPKEVELAENPDDYDSDFTAVKLEPLTRRVILGEKQQLDFGGILKGYLARKLSCNISSTFLHCTGNIVNIGGDLHTEGCDETGKPFKFYILNPVTMEEVFTVLHNTSLATSGTYKRAWQTTAGQQHHILGVSNVCAVGSEVCSASVIHPDGALADAYTKLFLTQGTKKALEIVKWTDISYLVVLANGTVETNII